VKGVNIQGYYLDASMKVLICDDSMTVRKKLAATVVELTGCEVVEAKDGVSAVSKYESERPDIVFMDIMMPIKNGLEATEEIIRLDENATIIMLSSVGTKANLQQALKSGAKDFIQKPFELEKLKIIFENYGGEA
jgi:two-component system chemotaxis response regulator CheY